MVKELQGSLKQDKFVLSIMDIIIIVIKIKSS